MSCAPRPAPAARFRLVAHGPGETLAQRRGKARSAALFLADVRATAAALPDAGHVLNFCADRYRFAVVLCAAIVRRQLTLLPPTMTPNVIAAMRAFAPDAYYVSDDEALGVELPRAALAPLAADDAPGDSDVPEIPADQVFACVFTSGSTGEPQPHYKTWGAMVRDIGAEAGRFNVGPGHRVLGTVPPQHMYGFESTVLLPLLSGATLTAERLYYPADIDAALQQAGAPRTLFTTPFHLRTWIDSGTEARLETIVSATAPLSVGLAREAEQRTGARLLEIYGCTEAGQVATRRTAEGPEWQAYDGMRLWTEDGRAFVGGGHVESATALADVIEPLGDGSRFLLHGRTADLVNIAGKRNSIGYLDHQLTAIDGVRDGAFLLPDDEAADGVTRLMAFVVAPDLTEAQVRAQLRDRIDAAFMPRPLVKVDSLPRALSGKLPRAALLDLARRMKK